MSKDELLSELDLIELKLKSTERYHRDADSPYAQKLMWRRTDLIQRIQRMDALSK